VSRLLVCAPLGIEARAVRRGLGRLPDVTVIRTGPGRAPPLPMGFGALVVAGFGGALRDGIDPGDALVASEVRYAGRRLPCPGAGLLVRALRDAGVRAQAGPLLTVDHVVWRRAELRRLGRTGAVGIDLEAGCLLAAAGGRPVAVVRAVVDTPRRPLPSPATVTGGLAARRTLRRIGPALLAWSAATTWEGERR
jgi:4-hydroxy-3-methylbut-2-enyl diphosphate reductase